MSKTYPYGYNTPAQQLTVQQLESKWTWRTLHPEMRRRLIALFDAAQEAGKVLGVGEAARSSAQQTTVFLQRHDVVTSGGCCSYNGKRYALKKGLAHAAPPGKSWHEDGSYETFAMAADLVGDLVWMKTQAAKFGLIEFSEVNKEPWHVQCVEFPKSRSQYNGEKLTVWPLPQSPTPVPPTPIIPSEEDEMFYINSPKPGTLPDLIWTAGKVYGIASQTDAQAFLNSGAKRLVLSEAQYNEIVKGSRP
jgi:hypothetical protein